MNPWDPSLWVCFPLSGSMSIMFFLRFTAIGLLSGTVLVPFLWIQRGDNFDHIRLAALMGLEIALAVGALWKRSWRTPPGFVLGVVTSVFGALVVTQATAAMRWLEGNPSGVGNPDGEVATAAVTTLAGGVALLVGTLILIDRSVALTIQERHRAIRRRIAQRRETFLS